MIQISDVFGRRPWLSEDPQRRAAAVGGSHPELLAVLPELARNDPDAKVRLAALAQLDDFAIWCERCANDPAPQVRGRARDQVVKYLLHAGTAPAAGLRWLAAQHDQDLFALLAHEATDPHLRAAAIERCTRQGALAECVRHDKVPDNRTRALQKIDQPSTLKRLQKTLRATDKVWFAKVERRLDELTGGRQHLQRRLAQLNRAAEDLLRGVAGGNLAAGFEDLRAAFAALAAPPSEPLARRLAGSLQIIEQAVHGGSRPAAAQALDAEPENRLEPPLASAAQPPTPALERLQKRLAALRRKAHNGQHDPTALTRWQKKWDRQWAEITDPGPADRHCAEIVHSWLGEIAHVADHRPQSTAQPPPVAATELLAQLTQSLDEGHLADAHSAAQRLAALPVEQRKPLHQEVNAALQRLDELRRWQHWANHRRRLELIRHLVACDPDALHPDALTVALNQTFAEWQTLERQERAAGLPGGGHLWPRLQRAAGRLRQRIEPFAARRARLRETYTEALQRTFSIADEWLAAEPLAAAVGRRLRRELAAGLRQMDLVKSETRRELVHGARRRLREISGRLQRAAVLAETEKQALIAAARALQPDAGRPELKQQVGQLQSRWQAAGHAGTRREQALWREFRAAIEALFAGVDAEQRARDENKRQRVQRAAALCGEWEALAAGGPEAAARRDERERLATAWRELGPVPEALQRRWRQAETVVRQSDELARRERQKEALRTICSAAAAASAERQQWVQAALKGPAPSLPAGLAPEWACLAPAEREKRLAEQAAAARRVCVEFEYLLHLPSPAADRTLRMQHQVEMLNRQLAGRGAPPSQQSQIEELNRRWQDASPMTAKDYDALSTRIAAVQQKIIDSG